MISTTTIKSLIASLPSRVTLFKGAKVKTILNETVLNLESAETPPAVFGVYTAEFSQTTISTTSGVLVSGKKYLILNLEAGDDFDNVGYVSEGTIFTASGTTPTTWTNSTVVINVTDSVQTANTLKNSVGEVTLAYAGVGEYEINSSDLFINNFTFFPVKKGFVNEDSESFYTIERVSSSKIVVKTYNSELDLTDNLLSDTSIEFRVYPD